MPGQFFWMKGLGLGEGDIHGLAGTLFGLGDAGAEIEDIAGGFDHPFGEKKTRGEFSVVSWGAHDHRDTLPFHADFQRFFDSEEVVDLAETLPLVEAKEAGGAGGRHRGRRLGGGLG